MGRKQRKSRRRAISLSLPGPVEGRVWGEKPPSYEETAAGQVYGYILRYLRPRVFAK